MNREWFHRRGSAAGAPHLYGVMRAAVLNARRSLAVCAAVGTVVACSATALSATTQSATAHGASAPGYLATIVRTADGIPHITASNFGSLGYGYGYALASDDICTMANGYLTVEAQRSRYFGASNSDPNSGFNNLDSDIFWQSVIDRRTIPKLLAIRTGPDAIGPQLRDLISGYVAGYNDYLASVGGSAGVPDPTCRGKAWVKPITTLDAYLLIYQAVDMEGQVGDIPGIAEAQPPSTTAATAGQVHGDSLTADVSGTPAALSARAASVVRTPPGSNGLPSTQQLRDLGEQLSSGGQQGRIGSNAIAIGSAGTRDHRHGVLLGNPHFPWDGIDRFYEVQFTIPGTMNVEGATLYGIPLVVIGFTATMAWSQTVSTADTITPYQLTLVQGHPTEYVYNNKMATMTSQAVTVEVASANGTITPVSRTLWYTRYGPVINSLEGMQLPWNTQMAFALADVNAGNLRLLNHYLATDEAGSVAAEFAILKKYQGLPWVNTIAADSSGEALFSDIQAIPDITDAEAEQCDTALGATSFQATGVPVLDGSRPSCAWGTGPGAAVPGIFGPAKEPSLMTRDFVENSNDSFWLANPAHPLTGFPRIMGQSGTYPGPVDLRTRSALTMVMSRISGTDGLGPPGFTFQDMKNLMFSDIQYGASLVKPQLVSMCRSFPGALAPTSEGTIPVGDSCSVLAAWNGRENPGSRGAVLFREFWENALGVSGGPWTHPFSAANPVNTPYGLNTGSKGVQQAFGDALAALTAAHLPYDVALGTVQYVVRNGKQIPLPGGPGDPDGEFDGIYQSVLQDPGTDPGIGSSYIQDVTWTTGDPCPEAATLLTYSESDNPDSPYYADQTELFSHSQWVTAYFCPAQVAAHAVSTTVLHTS
jgi:acyl-homoserine-lactone acylase